MSSRDLKMEITNLARDSMEFTLRNSDVTTANTLRRVMIAEIPTLAIDRVRIAENTSVLMDEFLAHRLGLIPMRYAGLMDMNLSEMEELEVMLSLNVEGDDPDGDRVVTSRDLVVDTRAYNKDNVDVAAAEIMHFSSEEEAARCSEDYGIRIARLAYGQQIDLVAIATVNVGKVHSKWSPVSTVTFRAQPSVELDTDRVNDLKESEKEVLANSCPRKVFEYNQARGTVVVANEDACILCDECVKRAGEFEKPAHDMLRISSSDKDFHFTMETTGALRPEEVLSFATNVVINKLAGLDGVVEELKREAAGEEQMGAVPGIATGYDPGLLSGAAGLA